jgi:Effector-associated domain 1
MLATGKQSEELHRALLLAFPTKGDLARVVKHKLGQNLDAIACDGNLSDIVVNLVTWLESKNLVDHFVPLARQDNAGNEELRSFEDLYCRDSEVAGHPPASASVKDAFARETRHARRQIKSTIPGLEAPLHRSEVDWIEERLGASVPVIFTGDAGTGKSGVADSLAEAALRDGKAVLFIDSRRTAYIQNTAQLQEHLGITTSPLSAIEDVARRKRCRVIIEQLDSSIGYEASRVLVDFAIDCFRIDGVEVLVVSRKREANEVALLQQLTKEGFREHTSYPLGSGDAEQVLEQLGISSPPPKLVELCCNLLNLELVARIKSEQPTYDFSEVTAEVDLWEHYIESITEHERVLSNPQAARQVIAEAMRLAKSGLNRADRTFLLDHDVSHQQGRLISGVVIIPEQGRRFRFRHEKLQDYLYARDAFERTLMPKEIEGEINQIRTANIIQWMDKLYRRSGSDEARRQFLEEAWDVSQ